jgi:Asp/Glu/hydantoin racemase
VVSAAGGGFDVVVVGCTDEPGVDAARTVVALGGHTDDVLSGVLAMSPAEIELLRRDVVGPMSDRAANV